MGAAVESNNFGLFVIMVVKEGGLVVLVNCFFNVLCNGHVLRLADFDTVLGECRFKR